MNDDEFEKYIINYGLGMKESVKIAKDVYKKGE